MPGWPDRKKPETGHGQTDYYCKQDIVQHGMLLAGDAL